VIQLVKSEWNKLYFGDDDSLVAEVMIILLLVEEHCVYDGSYEEFRKN
jgi:alpha-glucuronidase